METIKTEKVTIVTQYKAIDGTVFNTESECRAYEETAAAVINAKYIKYVLGETSEYNLFGAGCDDYMIQIVSVNKESIDVILLKGVQECSHYRNNETKLKELEESLYSNINKNILIYRGYNDDFIIAGTMEDHLNKLKDTYNKLIAKC